MMTKLALPLAVMLGAAVGTAHAAGMATIGQDDSGQAVVGGPGGARPIAPQGAWDVPTFRQPPVANAPPQQTKPPAKPSGTSQPAP
jgi:hypothetical protein